MIGVRILGGACTHDDWKEGSTSISYATVMCNKHILRAYLELKITSLILMNLWIGQVDFAFEGWAQLDGSSSYSHG